MRRAGRFFFFFVCVCVYVEGLRRYRREKKKKRKGVVWHTSHHLSFFFFFFRRDDEVLLPQSRGSRKHRCTLSSSETSTFVFHDACDALRRYLCRLSLSLSLSLLPSSFTFLVEMRLWNKPKKKKNCLPQPMSLYSDAVFHALLINCVCFFFSAFTSLKS